jgi:hypothetical protein
VERWLLGPTSNSIKTMKKANLKLSRPALRAIPIRIGKWSGPQIPTVMASAQIDNVSRGAYAASPYTLLMFVRSSCHFCTASMPFYKGLTVPEPPLNKLQFVVADSEPAEMARNYLAAHQVKVNDITPGSPDVPTPTLILVDKSGVIKAFWVGQLNDSGEREVKATLARLTM